MTFQAWNFDLLDSMTFQVFHDPYEPCAMSNFVLYFDSFTMDDVNLRSWHCHYFIEGGVIPKQSYMCLLDRAKATDVSSECVKGEHNSR